jgi:hypothetical protein
MTAISIRLDGDNAWPDLDPDRLIHCGSDWELAVLPGGMSSGAPSVALRVKAGDGRDVVAETSMAAWIAATATMRGRYADEFAGGPLAPGRPDLGRNTVAQLVGELNARLAVALTIAPGLDSTDPAVRRLQEALRDLGAQLPDEVLSYRPMEGESSG